MSTFHFILDHEWENTIDELLVTSNEFFLSDRISYDAKFPEFSCDYRPISLSVLIRVRFFKVPEYWIEREKPLLHFIWCQIISLSAKHCASPALYQKFSH